MEKAKLGFFKRVKKAIFNFDEYEKFIEEPLKEAWKYFFKVVAIFSIIISIVGIYEINTCKNQLIADVKQKFPEFEIKDNTLQMEDTDTFEYNLEKFNIQIIMDKNQTSYPNLDYENATIFLKDKIVMIYSGNVQEIQYKDININEAVLNKKEIIDFVEQHNMGVIYLITFQVFFIVLFVISTVLILIDVFTLSVLGLIINKIINTKFKYADIFKISIYSLTLPIILNTIYMIVNVISGITIKYFAMAYDTISYIYLITVMLMMRAEMIKNMQELQKIVEEQKKVREELKQEKEEEEKKDKEKEKPEKGRKE